VFNIFYSDPASYWAIIMPLFLSVDMLNDSMTLHAHESVKYALFKRNARGKNDESKANGTFEHDVIVDFAKRLNAGAENNRKEIRAPKGFDEFGPRLFAEDSGDAAADTLLMEFVLPGVTPGQAFTYDSRYTREERGTGTEKILQVFSKTHQVSHAVFADSALNHVLSRREHVVETVWKKLKLENGNDMFLVVNQRKSRTLTSFPPHATNFSPHLRAQPVSTTKLLLQKTSFARSCTTG
jgi:hypothetical protein